MISAGDFYAKRNDCRALLKRLELLEVWEENPSYPTDLPAIMRAKNYREQWEHCNENRNFDAKLLDGTLVQFRREDTKLSYSLMVAPVEYPKFEDFAFQLMGEDWEKFELELREEFEVAASSEIHERPVTPIGINNSIRVGTRRILNPVSFCLFIIRQCYPEYWEIVKKMHEFEYLCRQIRENIPEVGKKKFKGKDFIEAYLH